MRRWTAFWPVAQAERPAIADELHFRPTITGSAVYVRAELGTVPFAPRTPALLQKCLDGSATPGETAEFRECWQARVQALLLKHGDDPTVFVVRAAARKPMPA